MVVCVAAILMPALTSGLIVIVIELLFAVAGEAHCALDVSSQVITSLLTSVFDVYVLVVAACMFPLRFHVYAGDEPAFTVVATNVTLLPAQAVVLPVLIWIDGTNVGITLIVTVFEVAVVGEAHVALLVITQENTSLAARPLARYVADVAPLMLLPFFFHW